MWGMRSPFVVGSEGHKCPCSILVSSSVDNHVHYAPCMSTARRVHQRLDYCSNGSGAVCLVASPYPWMLSDTHQTRTGGSQLSCAGDYTCVINADNALTCWGAPRSETPPPEFTQNVASVSVGPTHTCGILTDNRMRCWYERVRKHTPPPPPSVCHRGSNASGESNPQAAYASARVAAAGAASSCVVALDGTLCTWLLVLCVWIQPFNPNSVHWQSPCRACGV